MPPLLEETRGELDAFVGRAGLEAYAVLEAGAAGLIPGFKSFDRLTALFNHLVQGRNKKKAEAVCHNVEPTIVFNLRSINYFVTYSREVSGRRLGHETIHHRLGVEVAPLASI